jgi:hypothetical protein
MFIEHFSELRLSSEPLHATLLKLRLRLTLVFVYTWEPLAAITNRIPLFQGALLYGWSSAVIEVGVHVPNCL